MWQGFARSLQFDTNLGCFGRVTPTRDATRALTRKSLSLLTLCLRARALRARAEFARPNQTSRETKLREQAVVLLFERNFEDRSPEIKINLALWSRAHLQRRPARSPTLLHVQLLLAAVDRPVHAGPAADHEDLKFFPGKNICEISLKIPGNFVKFR